MSTDSHPDGMLLGECLDGWERDYLSLRCQGCQRDGSMGVRRAIRLARGPHVRIGALGRRLRCQECGHRGAAVVVVTDLWFSRRQLGTLHSICSEE